MERGAGEIGSGSPRACTPERGLSEPEARARDTGTLARASGSEGRGSARLVFERDLQRLDGARDSLEPRVDPQRQQERSQRGARPAQAQEALAEAGLRAEVVRVELQGRRAV